MNFFPKKPYEGLCSPLFCCHQGKFSLKNPVFMRVSIPKTHLLFIDGKNHQIPIFGCLHVERNCSVNALMVAPIHQQ